MQLIVNDLLTNYLQTGSGPTVLFLHGWGDAAVGSSALQERLSQKYTVVAPDLPGFGKTAAPREAWGLDEYAAFVAAFIQKLEIGQPAAIIGHSNGGAIAIRGLAKEMLSTQKLVLIGSAGVRSGMTAKRAMYGLVAKAGKLATLPLPRGTRQKLQRKLYQRIGSDYLVAEHLQATFKRVVAQDVQDDAKKIKDETLLIYGSDDAATPPWMGQKLQQLITNSRYEEVTDAGHFVHIDKMTETANLIEGFLND